MRRRCGIAAIWLCGALFLFGCVVRGITGQEWVARKFEMMDESQAFALNLDSIVTLYSINAIETEDYMNELLIADQAYAYLRSTDTEERVRPGGQSEETIRAMQAYVKIWDDFGDLLEILHSQEAEDDRNYLVYQYMAYRDDILSNVLIFSETYYSLFPDKAQAETREE